MTLSFAKLSDLIQIAEPPAGMNTKIIAIDGCGGAGKSTLAAAVSKLLNNCPVIHTDDFASWDNSQSWSPRILAQVLEPLRQGKKARFQRYDWSKRALDNWLGVEPQEFVIIEGVSSARREFRPYLAFSIFVQTDRSLRLTRGLERNGEQARTQWLDWMRQEDEYILRDQPEEFVDIVVAGTQWQESENLTCFGGKAIEMPSKVSPHSTVP